MSSITKDSISTCANCGKGGEGDNDIQLKTCTACKLVKYCSRECQATHRQQHKKECKKRAAELHNEKLFKQPPQLEDCPICFLLMPSLWSGHKYMTCCGKFICTGCVVANIVMNGADLCPFCRTPIPATDEQFMKNYEKRVELGDVHAIYDLGCLYDAGTDGFPQNKAKALELWQQAADLGHTESYYNIGNTYMKGDGVQRNTKKALHYWEQAAILGHGGGRYNLGLFEKDSDRALKHWMIAARSGDTGSLEKIKQLYTVGYATKDDYAKALRTHQAYLDEIKSDQRDEAAALDDDNKYY